MKNKIKAIPFLCAILIIGLFAIYRLFIANKEDETAKEQAKKEGQTPCTGTKWELEAPQKKLLYWGLLNPVERHPLYTPVNGVLEKYLTRDGDNVEAGQPIVQLRQVLGAVDVRPMVLKAPKKGYVQHSEFRPGDVVSSYQWPAQILVPGARELSLSITSEDAEAIFFHQKNHTNDGPFWTIQHEEHGILASRILSQGLSPRPQDKTGTHSLSLLLNDQLSHEHIFGPVQAETTVHVPRFVYLVHNKDLPSWEGPTPTGTTFQHKMYLFNENDSLSGTNVQEVTLELEWGELFSNGQEIKVSKKDQDKVKNQNFFIPHQKSLTLFETKSEQKCLLNEETHE
jgi:biotin carboxyl carrier protein